MYIFKLTSLILVIPLNRFNVYISTKLLSVHWEAKRPSYNFTRQLTEPVADIFNPSLSSGIVPAIWKVSNITPVPIKGEAATIPMLSQGVEVFIVFIEHNGNEINPHQFGSFEGSSTSCRLIDLLRNWLLTVQSAIWGHVSLTMDHKLTYGYNALSSLGFVKPRNVANGTWTIRAIVFLQISDNLCR